MHKHRQIHLITNSVLAATARCWRRGRITASIVGAAPRAGRRSITPKFRYRGLCWLLTINSIQNGFSARKLSLRRAAREWRWKLKPAPAAKTASTKPKSKRAVRSLSNNSTSQGFSWTLSMSRLDTSLSPSA